MVLINKGEPDFSTSSVGIIAFLLLHDIRPNDLTLPPDVACLYWNKDINWGEMMNSYWMGERMPGCEMAEAIVVANRILKEQDIVRSWFTEMEEALDDVREDYVFPI